MGDHKWHKVHTRDILVLRCVDDFPEFGEVKKIVIDNEREVAFVVCVLETECLDLVA